MPAPIEGEPTLRQRRVLLGMLVLVSAALAWILLPLYGPILWGTIIALLFAPLHRRLLRRLAHHHTTAALLTLLVVLVMGVLPLALIAAALAREATGVYEQLQSGELSATRYFRSVFDALPAWATQGLGRVGLSDFDTLQRRLTEALARGSQLIATRALGIGQITVEFVVDLFIALYLAFFLIRDGAPLAHTLRHAIPLAPAHRSELVDKFKVVIRATIKGNLLVAVLQGLLGGLAFWFLGLEGALLWGVVMAFLSLLPAVGPTLVWVPVALYLLLTGSIWHGVALAAWGAFVIGLVDNLLRPILVGKDTQLPDHLVLLTTLGGMAVFGINGFVLGPTIAAMFVAVLHIHGVTRVDAP
jgi:predicted PurR-regulated permease PerM